MPYSFLNTSPKPCVQRLLGFVVPKKSEPSWPCSTPSPRNHCTLPLWENQVILTNWLGDSWFQIAMETKKSLTWRSGSVFLLENLNTRNDCRVGLETGWVKSVPTVCLLPRWYLRRPAEYTHNLPNACLTEEKKKKSATSAWTLWKP